MEVLYVAIQLHYSIAVSSYIDSDLVIKVSACHQVLKCSYSTKVLSNIKTNNLVVLNFG